jgi:hypothetical protein
MICRSISLPFGLRLAFGRVGEVTMGEMRMAIVQWPVWLSVRNLTVDATPPPPPRFLQSIQNRWVNALVSRKVFHRGGLRVKYSIKGS